MTGGWWRSAVRLWYYFSKFLPLLHISESKLREPSRGRSSSSRERKGDRKFLEGFLASSRRRAIDVRLCATTDATARAAAAPPSCRFHKPFQKSGAQTDMEERRDAIEVAEAVAAVVRLSG